MIPMVEPILPNTGIYPYTCTTKAPHITLTEHPILIPNSLEIPIDHNENMDLMPPIKHLILAPLVGGCFRVLQNWFHHRYVAKRWATPVSCGTARTAAQHGPRFWTLGLWTHRLRVVWDYPIAAPISYLHILPPYPTSVSCPTPTLSYPTSLPLITILTINILPCPKQMNLICWVSVWLSVG